MDGRVICLDGVVQFNVLDVAFVHLTAGRREFVLGEGDVGDLNTLEASPAGSGRPGEERDVTGAEGLIDPFPVDAAAHGCLAAPVSDDHVVAHGGDLNVGA